MQTFWNWTSPSAGRTISRSFAGTPFLISWKKLSSPRLLRLRTTDIDGLLSVYNTTEAAAAARRVGCRRRSGIVTGGGCRIARVNVKCLEIPPTRRQTQTCNKAYKPDPDENLKQTRSRTRRQKRTTAITKSLVTHDPWTDPIGELSIERWIKPLTDPSIYWVTY